MGKRQAQHPQLHYCLAELQVAVLPRIRVDAQGDMFFALQDILHQFGQDIPGAKFHKDAAAGLVNIFDLVFEKDGVQDLLFQDGVLLGGIIGIGLAGGIGINRDGRLAEVLRVHKTGKGSWACFT